MKPKTYKGNNYRDLEKMYSPSYFSRGIYEDTRP